MNSISHTYFLQDKLYRANDSHIIYQLWMRAEIYIGRLFRGYNSMSVLLIPIKTKQVLSNLNSDLFVLWTGACPTNGISIEFEIL